MGFSKKALIFTKKWKSSKFAPECDWITQISWNVQNLGFWQEAAFFEKNYQSVYKIAKISNFPVECDWFGKISQNSRNIGAFFQKTDGFSEKNLKNLKDATGSQFSLQCEWLSKISQNVQKLAILWRKNGRAFQKKFLEFFHNR